MCHMDIQFPKKEIQSGFDIVVTMPTQVYCLFYEMFTDLPKE